MEDTFTLFLVAMVVTQSSICLLPLVSKVFTDRVSVESVDVEPWLGGGGSCPGWRSR